MFEPGQWVEVWLAGWDRWYPGVIAQVGNLSGTPCVAVRFPDKPCPCIYRCDQVRIRDETTRDVQTLREPLGGLFESVFGGEELT